MSCGAPSPPSCGAACLRQIACRELSGKSATTCRLPSSAMAEYFVIQLARFGLDAVSLTRTGLLFADDLQKLREGDLVVILAYGRLYRELMVMLDTARRRGVGSILLTDTLVSVLRRKVDLVLPVARGRADMLSMHTATLGLIEALLVGVAMRR